MMRASGAGRGVASGATFTRLLVALALLLACAMVLLYVRQITSSATQAEKRSEALGRAAAEEHRMQLAVAERLVASRAKEIEALKAQLIAVREEHERDRHAADESMAMLRRELDEAMGAASAESFDALFDAVNTVRAAAYSAAKLEAPHVPRPSLHPRTAAPAEVDCSAWAGKEHRIPRVAYLVWKNEALIEDAAKLDAEWREKEPCVQRRIVTDIECRQLARRVPGLLPWYERLPMNVMRADLCRVMAVYFYGGIYMDMDVQWAKPLIEWFNVSSDFVLGKEYNDGTFFCNWFFAAEAMHPCMWNVITNISARISREFKKEDFAVDPWLVHKTTGPETFAYSLRGCVAATLTSEQVNTEYIKHLYGSQKWRFAKGYKSWNEERMKLAGWKSMLGNGMLKKEQQDYVYANPETLLGKPADDQPALKVASSRISHPLIADAPMFFDASLIIDGNLESYAITKPTGRDVRHLVEVVLVEPLRLPSADGVAASKSESTTLHCVKVFMRKDGDVRIATGYEIVLADARGVTVHASGPIGVDTPYLYRIPASTGNDSTIAPVKAIQIQRSGELQVAEVQLFTDAACAAHRQLALPPPVDYVQALVAATAAPNSSEAAAAPTASMHARVLTEFFATIARRTYNCPDVTPLGENYDNNQMYWACGMHSRAHFRHDDPAVTSPCAALEFGATDDSSLESTLVDFKCQPHLFDRRRNPNPEKPIPHNSLPSVWVWGLGLNARDKPAEASAAEKTRSIEEAMRLAEMSRISFLRLSQGPVEWEVVQELVDLAKERRIDQLGVEFHLCFHPSSLDAAEYFLRQLRLLLTEFDIFAVRPELILDERREAPLHGPCFIKASLIRRSLLLETHN